jgi:NitT/TauT family transport system permease protein
MLSTSTDPSVPPTSGRPPSGADPTGSTSDDAFRQELSGLDALELAEAPAPGRWRRLWSLTWPKLAAITISLTLWQLVVWSGWKPTYVLPGPVPVFQELWHGLTDGALPRATWFTMQRAIIGYSIALVVGVVVGGLVSQIKVLRIAVGSMITGLQTMPSIAWFPLAILLFKLSEGAILFVIVVGAAPAIANGLIAGTDNIPPVLLRAGRVLGARGFTLYRNVVLPASLPSFVSGMKQGWAFAWRSLLAGELLVIIATKPSIGYKLQVSRDLSDAEGLMATMIVILVIGIIVDSLFFGKLELAIRRRWGLIDNASR